ncbi:unnamed protein product [Amaranthus hypochondriacus]
MEKAKNKLELSKEEAEVISKLAVNPHRPNLDKSFYEDFSLRGIRVDRVDTEILLCSFKVPPRLTDREGNLAPGAIANLVDEIGGLVIYREGLPMNASISMSISYVSTAKVDDVVEISARLLGRKGSLFGTIVLLKNKVTGEVIAEGRHTLFSKHASKI